MCESAIGPLLLSIIQPAIEDSGPIYRETVLGRLPVEPWNTFSNLIFLFVLFYFSYRVWRSSKRHLYLKSCLPVILVGYIGGTVYHATRSGEVWLLMDWIPIVLLCVATAIYFALSGPRTTLGKVAMVTVALGVGLGFRYLPFPGRLQTSMGYVGTVIGVLIPILYFGYRTGWKYFGSIVIAIVCFATAVTFRSLDRILDKEIFYMGTHWLWHALGGIASFFVFRYVYVTEEKELI